MALAREEDEITPLAEAELTRLVRAAGDAGYQPDQAMPKARSTDFHKRSLMDIAREATPEPAPPPPMAAAPPLAEVTAPPEPQPVLPEAPPDATAPAARPEVMPETPTAATPKAEPAPAPPIDAPAATAPTAPAVSTEALRAARSEGYREGEAAGAASGRAEAEAAANTRLAQAIAALEAATAALSAPDAGLIAALRHEISQTVLALASARAGVQIDTLPGAFLRRIEALTDRVQADLAQTAIRLNPEDLRAVKSVLSDAAPLASARLIPDTALVRGDIDIAVGGLRLTDRIGIDPATADLTAPAAMPADAPEAEPDASTGDADQP